MPTAIYDKSVPHVNDLANSKLSGLNHDSNEPVSGNVKTVVFNQDHHRSAITSNDVTNTVGSDAISPHFQHLRSNDYEYLQASAPQNPLDMQPFHMQQLQNGTSEVGEEPKIIDAAS